MALKIMVCKRDLEGVETRLQEVETQLDDIEVRSDNNLTEYNSLKDSDDVEALEALVEKDEALESERSNLIQEREQLLEEMENLKKEIETLSAGKPAVKKIEKKDMDIRTQFNNMLHQKRDGFVSTDGSLIIPTDVIYTPVPEVYTEYNLLNYVNRVSVSTKSGSWPVLKRATAKLHTVEELAENPELAKPEFEEITYSVETYRGSLSISEESIADAAVDLVSLIAGDIQTQVLNTTNDLIGTKIQEFDQKTVKNIDEIKTILNKDLDPAYSRQFIMTQSMFNALDQLKDDHNRYLIQEDITDSSQRRLLGYPISVVRDTLLAEEGSMVCFVGDPKAAITYFDRAQIQARWVENQIYGQLLMIGFRCDVEIVDKKAGYYVTYSPTPVITPGGAGSTGSAAGDGLVKIKPS